MKKEAETAPIINIGLEALEKETSLSASVLVNCFSSRILAVNFAPVGKPDTMPIAQTNPPTPGTLKRGRIMGSNKTPIKRTTPKPIKISDKIRKGRSEGKTIVHHVFSPFLEASTATPEKKLEQELIGMQIKRVRLS